VAGFGSGANDEGQGARYYNPATKDPNIDNQHSDSPTKPFGGFAPSDVVEASPIGFVTPLQGVIWGVDSGIGHYPTLCCFALSGRLT